MLRAVRFAARFNLEIESRTAAAIRESAKNLGRISRERIGQEVRVMLVHPARADAIRLLQDHRLDGPVLQDDCQVGDDVVVPALPNECDYPTVLAGWAIDRAIGSAAKPDSLEALLKVLPQPRQIAQWRKALVLSNDERDAVKAIAQRLTDATQWSRLSTAGRKRVLTAPDWEQAAVLLQAIGLYDCMACEIEKLTNDGIGLTPEAFLDGQKLIALGVKPGPRLGELLTEVYDLQLEGELITMSDAERWIEQHR
jgi:poly(A) polymerase